MAFRAGMKSSMEPQGDFGLDRLRLLVVFGWDSSITREFHVKFPTRKA